MNDSKTPEVVFFHRKPRVCSYSLEYHFESVRNWLANNIESRVEIAPYFSQGVFRRIAILVHAWLRRGPINHVTGDISFLPLGLWGSKIVLTIPDCGEFRNRKGLSGWIFKLLWIRLPVLLSDRVTTISESSKKDICRIVGCNPSKIDVIPVAVSPEFVFERKSFNANRPRLLQVGTSQNKNLEGVIEAIAGLKCLLAIIGKLSESQMSSLNSMKIDYENFVGLTTEKVAEQYRLADIVMFASHFEGFGMPVIEAQSTGRPVIVGNNSSLPEVAGAGACFVDSQAPAEIRSALIRIIQDKEYRDNLVELGKANASRFDQQAVSLSYLRIYQSLS